MSHLVTILAQKKLHLNTFRPIAQASGPALERLLRYRERSAALRAGTERFIPPNMSAATYRATDGHNSLPADPKTRPFEKKVEGLRLLLASQIERDQLREAR